jgi:hypothetical protein
MPKTVDAVFFDMLHLSFCFARAFVDILHGSTSLQTSPLGGKECGPEQHCLLNYKGAWAPRVKKISGDCQYSRSALNLRRKMLPDCTR